jgi:hypothetical protein
LFRKVIVGTVKPGDHTINLVHVGLSSVDGVHPEIDVALREFLEFVGREPLTEIGDAFSFRWIQSLNGADHSMWVLYFTVTWNSSARPMR